MLEVMTTQRRIEVLVDIALAKLRKHHEDFPIVFFVKSRVVGGGKERMERGDLKVVSTRKYTCSVFLSMRPVDVSQHEHNV